MGQQIESIRTRERDNDRYARREAFALFLRDRLRAEGCKARPDRICRQKDRQRLGSAFALLLPLRSRDREIWIGDLERDEICLGDDADRNGRRRFCLLETKQENSGQWTVISGQLAFSNHRQLTTDN